MPKPRVTRFLTTDIFIVLVSYLIMAFYRVGTLTYLSWKYLVGFGIFLTVWLLSSFIFEKYMSIREAKPEIIVRRILLSNFVSISVILIILTFFSIVYYSRFVLSGTVLLATILELTLSYFYYYLVHTRGGSTDIYNPPPKNYDLKKVGQSVTYHDVLLQDDYIKQAIVNEKGEEVYRFFGEYIHPDENHILCVSTSTRFNIEFQPDGYFTKIINLKKVNDVQYINKFFETVNRKLPVGGLFFGFVETKNLRKERILKKYPPGLNYLFYTADFIARRVFPKFILTKKIYFFLTRGHSRVLTKAETFGRLYSCGFEEASEKVINGYDYFIMRKKDSPAYDMNPTYGPFITLNRIGKGGKVFKVYKFRTMHPYAEYLQDYIYKKNNLNEGGKFRDDFRVTTSGKLMRKLWIDELPMILNMLRGDMKLVGVRPLSRHYFNLYSEELQSKRTQSKPGLIPPFYADMPKTLEEIQESELRYLDAYFKNPLRTDCRYLWKALTNILIKRARSN